MKKRSFTIFGVFLFANSLLAQKEGNIWCFGANAELDFNSGTPICRSTSAMNEFEGCSSISDLSGNLLLYTDGGTVWNKNNVAMPNGTGLLGGTGSSTQAAEIVKQPGNTNIFYVFTTDFQQGPNGFKYSIVDMNLQSGLGDVTAKNVNILPVCDERVAAIYNRNENGVWVLTTTGNADTIQAFLLTSTGFDATPVVSVSGITHGASYQGYLKPSPSGNQLAVAYFNGGFDVYNFDRSTGVVCNPVALQNPGYWSAYGVEFSPDGKLLYGVDDEGYSVYQFDLTAGSAAAIKNSVQVIGTTSDDALGALQVGPDGKIYLARYETYYLGVINSPNVRGTQCNYVDSGLRMVYGSVSLGLPNIFMYHTTDSLSNTLASFSASDTSICTGSSINFTSFSNGATYQWSFPGGSPDTSTVQNPSNILYNEPGQYSVQLIAATGCATDTLLLSNYIHVSSSQLAGSITGHPDTVCAGGNSLLTLNGAVGNIQWDSAINLNSFVNIPGAESVTYTTGDLQESTYYRARLTGGCGLDTTIPLMIVVNPSPTPPTLSTPDPIICASDSAKVLATTGYTTYFWNDGDTSNYTYVNVAGGYWVTVTNVYGCSAVSGHQNISVYPPITVSIDLQGDTLTSFNSSTYQWLLNDTIIPSATNPVYVAQRSGLYAVQITDSNGCTERSNDQNVVIAGFKNITEGDQLSIFPNPFNNSFYIENRNAGIAINAIDIYDLSGQLLFNKTGNIQVGISQIEPPQLATGVYYLKIKSSRGNSVYRLIKTF